MRQEFDSTCVITPYTNYFFYGPHVVPRIVESGRKRIDQSTGFRQIRLSTYAYVHDGSGRVNINGSVYPLAWGAPVEFWNYHLFSRLPEKALEISYCQLQNGSVYTFYNNPYSPHSTFKTLLDETCPVWQLQPSEISTMEPIWNTILRLREQGETGSPEYQLDLMMEFLGWLAASKNGGFQRQVTAAPAD